MLSLSSSLTEDLCAAVLSVACGEGLLDNMFASQSYQAKGSPKGCKRHFIDFSINTLIRVEHLSQPIVGLDSRAVALAIRVNFTAVYEKDNTGNLPYDKVVRDIVQASLPKPRVELRQVMLVDEGIKPFGIQYGDELMLSGFILNKIHECAKDNVILAALFFIR